MYAVGTSSSQQYVATHICLLVQLQACDLSNIITCTSCFIAACLSFFNQHSTHTQCTILNSAECNLVSDVVDINHINSYIMPLEKFRQSSRYNEHMEYNVYCVYVYMTTL